MFNFLSINTIRTMFGQASKSSLSQSSRFSLPGLTLPLNWIPEWSGDPHVRLFRHALGMDDDEEAALDLTPLREFTMLRIMDSITDKPNWNEKVFNETISEKWKHEMVHAEDRDVTEAMANWIIEELRYKAQIFKDTGAVSIYNGDVVKSDIAVTSDLKQSLRSNVRILEDIPEVYKDYHPGSDDKVLDLVHPSLFPLIYGRSRVLKDTLIGLDDCIENIGKGIIVPTPPDDQTVFIKEKAGGHSYGGDNRPPFSKKFQWLPCEVEFSTDGSSKIVSYINNLHPQKHRELYAVVEQLIDKVIPLWNMTLTPLKHRHLKFERVPFESPQYDPDPEYIPDENLPARGDNEDENAYYDRIWEWKESQRGVIQPDAGEFQPPSMPEHLESMYFKPGTKELKEEVKVNLKRDYKERGLQIIVKLANIELTPEKPEYEGGSWHVEGQLNEHICATAIYYYDSENITASRLAFRQQSDTDTIDIGYPQNEEKWLEEIFGCQNWSAGVQEVGSVLCCEDRLLTFPNILQHQVQPFKLADFTKPGHRKIVAFFLVDPNIRVISTANVPPQQRSWWGEEIADVRGLNKLSAELKENIVNNVDDFPIGMDEAKEIRLELMEERKAYVAQQGKMFESPQFALCEH
ncbi:hypothetical protein F5884DRAFT_814113 [Xylogone sp. PMI_703]|nr:hypothetical protein F5884DRAFT_814113 [Xylogone sp. PMI_703]